MTLSMSRFANSNAEHVQKILDLLRPLYKNDKIEIDYKTPFQLVVATILSAQCTDKRVNEVTKSFFDKLKTPDDFLVLSSTELEKLIRPTGFFRNKAKNIQGAAEMIKRQFNGKIPESLEELVKLPGFGRKTANVILVELYDKNQGVCVDTHVIRLSGRLGLTRHKDAVRVERDLMMLTPQKSWNEISHFLILHGRRVCRARLPECSRCVLSGFCPSNGV